MNDSIYKQLCSLYSIDPYCLDAKGKKQPLYPDAQKDLVTALGIRVDEETKESILLELERRQWGRIIEPCLVVREKTDPFGFNLKLPESALHNPLYWYLREENGNRQEGECDPTKCSVISRHEFQGRKYVAIQLQLSLNFPCGYHTISFRGKDKSGKELNEVCTLIITPDSCYVPSGLQQTNRIWGLDCHIGTLRTRRNWGIGDFSDLRSLLCWTSQHGAGTLCVNPLQDYTHHIDERLYPHYFSSFSFINPIYLDPENIADFHESEVAGKLFQDPAFKARLALLRDQTCIDFSEVLQLKKGIFEILWHHFQDNHLDPDTDRGRDFRHFQEMGGENLRAYAIFEALREQFEEKGLEHWTTWPADFIQFNAEGVSDFADRHRERIEYHQYLQWQSEIQLASIGQRSMELGLKVGLLQTMAGSVSSGSFETWYRPDMFAMGMRTGLPDPSMEEISAIECPPIIFQKMAESAFTPFIAALRSNMRYSGALRIPHAIIAEEQYWLPREDSSSNTIYLHNKSTELLGIIALESQRNQCLVICEHQGKLPEHFRNTLVSMAIFIDRPGYFEKKPGGDWLPPEQYMPESIVSASDCNMTSLNGLWLGKDIERHSRLYPANESSWKEKQIISRTSDRVHLLVALHHQHLLPEGYDMDPFSVLRLSPDLTRAVHLYLAKTSAKIFLIPMQDFPSFQEQGIFSEESLSFPGWKLKIPIDLEATMENEQLHGLFRAFCRERGVGIIKPSALLVDRKASKVAQIPRAFYRLQLNSDFTFKRATEVVPYLSKLGISHCYTSPFLMARPGSPHGYDIIDHSSLNQEIGSRQQFEGFVAALDQNRLAQVIDIVPNHMGVGSDNRWWTDVLENGEASQYADFFDINWEPEQQELQGKVLLPILGGHYGSVLELGELCLYFDIGKGTFSIKYYQHSFPLDPSSYPRVLGHEIQRLEDVLGPQHEGLLEFQNLLSSFRALPDRQDQQNGRIKTRQRDKEVLKRLLARLCRGSSEIETFIQENVALFNGEKGRSESFDLLDALLARQAYRLTFWRVAADEINYRRFFDINDLAGIRMENRKVFEETHRFILDLIATGRVDGLRVDHPDGLYDPKGYCCWLQEAASGDNTISEKIAGRELTSNTRNFPLYVVVEKILADFEHLPTDWPVHGTTGYDFAVLVNGLLVDQTAERDLSRIYHRFIGHAVDFDDLLYKCKKMIIKTSMAGELNVLASELNHLAKMNRYTRDFTLIRLREALTEIVAQFPVYRTYIVSEHISKDDNNFIEWAISKAKAAQKAKDISIYDFLMAVMLLKVGSGKDETLRKAALNFVMKLQQYTGPIMAKGLEDTSFYIYNRLLSLNEVGGDPRRFGISEAAFHHGNRERANYYPHAMLNTSTHDSKRSEDVRSRINVLSEMPKNWQETLSRWSSLTKSCRTKLSTGYAPSRNDEYAFYQNLLGVWPINPVDEKALALLTERIEAYMLKAIREAKVHTSWINQDTAYEEAMSRFVRGVLAWDSPFLKEFLPFQKKISWFGFFNSVSQLALKLTSPGIPDIYQGSELWHFFLVDPDNRRPVDFHQRENMLVELQEYMSGPPSELLERARKLTETITDGRIKLYTIWKTLRCRYTYSDLFERGSYISLAVKGEKEKHICAFMRQHGEQQLIVAVPRLPAQLLNLDETRLPLGSKLWANTVIVLPDNFPRQIFLNILTGEEICTSESDNNYLDAASLFTNFPVCLLLQASD